VAVSAAAAVAVAPNLAESSEDELLGDDLADTVKVQIEVPPGATPPERVDIQHVAPASLSLPNVADPSVPPGAPDHPFEAYTAEAIGARMEEVPHFGGGPGLADTRRPTAPGPVVVPEADAITAEDAGLGLGVPTTAAPRFDPTEPMPFATFGTDPAEVVMASTAPERPKASPLRFVLIAAAALAAVAVIGIVAFGAEDGSAMVEARAATGAGAATATATARATATAAATARATATEPEPEPEPEPATEEAVGTEETEPAAEPIAIEVPAAADDPPVEDPAELEEPTEAAPEPAAADRPRTHNIVESRLVFAARYRRQGNLAAAKREYEAVLRRIRNNPRALAGLVAIAIEQNNGAEAVRWARRLTVASSENSNNYVLLGDAYKAAGDMRSARDAWQTALRMNPQNRRAQSRLR
jgi:hypothetical protein